MWTYLGTENYLINAAVKKNEILYIVVTDLVKVWQVSKPLQHVIKIFLDLNPLFEMDDSAIITKVLDLYGAGGTSEVGVTHVVTCTGDHDQEISLQSSSYIGKFTYQFNLSLQPASSSTLYEELTMPILEMLKSMIDREKKLVEIIQAKDREIEEYKLQNQDNPLQRRGVITEPFCYDSFETNPSSEEPSKYPASYITGRLQQHLSLFTKKPNQGTNITTETEGERAGPELVVGKTRTRDRSPPSFSCLNRTVIKVQKTSNLRL